MKKYQFVINRPWIPYTTYYETFEERDDYSITDYIRDVVADGFETYTAEIEDSIEQGAKLELIEIKGNI